MNRSSRFKPFALAFVLGLLMISTSAHAFRCGQKLVRETMHEIEVRKVCGAPDTAKNLGYVIRGAYVSPRNRVGGLRSRHFPGYAHYAEEVMLTEYVYNFGPRKLMRRLLFEDGLLVKIETMGYGFVETHGK